MRNPDNTPLRLSRLRRVARALAAEQNLPELTTVMAAKHGRPVVVVMAVEEYERLKSIETGHADSRPSTTGKAQ